MAPNVRSPAARTETHSAIFLERGLIVVSSNERRVMRRSPPQTAPHRGWLQNTR